MIYRPSHASKTRKENESLLSTAFALIKDAGLLSPCLAQIQENSNCMKKMRFGHPAESNRLSISEQLKGAIVTRARELIGRKSV